MIMGTRLRLASIIAGKKLAGAVAHEVKDYLLKALKVFVVGSGIVAVLAQWGINPWPYFAGIGVLSLPFAFAAKDAVSNVFGGIKLLIVDQAFRVGDWIESPSIGHGIVEGVTLSTVKVRKFSKAVQTVPNGVIAAEPITNWSRMSNRRIKETIGIRYEDAGKMGKIIELVRKMLLAHPEIDADKTLIVNFNAFAASSLDFFIYTFTKTTNWADYHQIKQDVLLKVLNIIEGQGAECAFPTSTVHVAGNNVFNNIARES